jgi:hypothetical protein
MSFEKFAYLILEKRLWFTRCDNLGDRHEGSLPKKIVEERNARLDNEILEDPSKYEEIQKVKRIFERGSCLSRLEKFASCWTFNDPESLLMWKLYTTNSSGIAIESSVSRICNCFVRKPNDFFERHEMTIANTIYEDFIGLDNIERDPVFYKRHAYKYENEIRAFAVFRSTVETLDHLSLPIVLEELINRIYVYSSSDSKPLKNLAEDLIVKCKIEKEVLIPRFDIDVLW